MVERGLTKMGFLFILVGSNIWIVFFGWYVIPWASVSHLICYLNYFFFKFNGTFQI